MMNGMMKTKIMDELENQLFGNTTSICCLQLDNTDNLSSMLQDRIKIITERIDSLSIERDIINKLLTYFNGLTNETN